MNDFFIILLSVGVLIGIPFFIFLGLHFANFIGTFINKGVTELENSLGEGNPIEASKEAEDKSAGQQINESTADQTAERAKVGDRFFAALADYIMVRLPLRLAFVFAAATSLIRPSLYYGLLYLLLDLILTQAYFAVFAHRRKGQTIGKKWNRIKVVDMEGKDLTLGTFMTREFAARGLPILLSLLSEELASAWIFTYFLAFTKERRALHDIIAGTQVIKVRE